MMSSSTLITKPGQLTKSMPDPVMVSRQIDGLREVMRRMRNSESNSLSKLIDKKLEQLADS